MFTNKIASYYSPGKVLIEAACLSTDTKPTTGVANGSKCIEMDTGKTYMFNEEDSEWEELPSSGGGGGGGSSDFSTATITFTNNTQYGFPITYSCIFESDDFTGIVNGDGIFDSDVLTVPLYKGFAAWGITDDVSHLSINTSGNVIYDEDDNDFYITGDCTITIS